MGKGRVYIDPDMTEEVVTAMTRGDIRKYIGLGFIKKKPAKGNSRGRKKQKDAQKKKGRQRGQGKRKGKQTARRTKKEVWMEKIRGQRTLLRMLKDAGKLDTRSYRELYKKAKAGVFKSKAHLKRYIKERGMEKEAVKPAAGAQKEKPKAEPEKEDSETNNEKRTTKNEEK